MSSSPGALQVTGFDLAFTYLVISNQQETLKSLPQHPSEHEAGQGPSKDAA